MYCVNIVISSTVHNYSRETELLALDGTLPVVIRGKSKPKVSARCGLFLSILHSLFKASSKRTRHYWILHVHHPFAHPAACLLRVV